MLFASGWHRLLLRPVAGFNGSTPACMSLVDPRDQCLSALRFARQSLFQHLDNVARCQQLQTRLMRSALLGDEQHREHDHGDVVVPCPPAQHLIVCQSLASSKVRSIQ